jgi:hypothetical protein
VAAANFMFMLSLLLSRGFGDQLISPREVACRSINPFITLRLSGVRRWLSRGDKAVKAQSIRGRMALEGLYVPTSATWYPELKHEPLSFPAGKHDDQVDALGLVGQLLDQMVPGEKPKGTPIAKARTGCSYSGHDSASA